MSSRATVVEVTPSLESAYYLAVTLRLEHDGRRPLRRPRYALRWPGGAKDGRIARDVTAGASVEVTVRVAPDSGDLAALLADPAAATVTLRG